MTDDLGGDPACWSHVVAREAPAAGDLADVQALRVGGASGVLWSAPPGELNANLVSLPAEKFIAEHREDEVDVVVVVLSGEAEVTVDDDVHAVTGQHVLVIPAGARRSIRASKFGLVYVTVHRARGPMQIKRAP